MSTEIETILEIALQEFAKVIADASKNKGVSPEVEEVEELPSGNYLVTLGYWSKDSKPNLSSFGDMPNKEAAHLALLERPDSPGKNDTIRDLLNPWRRRYKRVEIDPKKGKAVAIRMYEPALGVS